MASQRSSMGQAGPGQVLVERLRMQGVPDAVRVAAKLRVEHLLAGAEIWPPEMPPSAVLLVRHLADPLPGRLVERPGDLWPSPVWVAAMRSQLALLWRDAVRAQNGRVAAAGADAVAFDSQAEQTACLALRLAHGEQAAWWEQPLLRPLPSRTVAAVLADRPPAELPAIFAALDSYGAASAVAAELTETEALDLLHAAADAFGLPWVASLREPGLPHQASAAAVTEAGAFGLLRAVADACGLDRLTRLPELLRQDGRLVAGLPAGTAPAAPMRNRQALLLLTAALAGAPARARSQAFARAFSRWWTGHEAAGGGPLPEAPEPGRPERVAPAPETPEPETPEPETLAPDGPGREAAEQQATGETSVSPLTGAAPEGGLPPDAAPRRLAGAAVNSGDGDAPGGGADASPEVSRAAAAPAADGGPASGVAPEAAAGTAGAGGGVNPGEQSVASGAGEAEAQPLAAGTDTQLGGLLYLVNLLTRLELPDSVAGLDEAVSAWGLLEALGRGLLDGGPPGAGEWATDPLWRLLALLDGRDPGSLPGATCPPPPEGTLLPAGTLLPEGTSLPAEWPALPPGEPFQPGPLSQGLSPDLTEWLSLLIPYLSVWLREATDLPVAAVLTAPGRLYLTATHLDLVLRLDGALLPVRLSGLDRDPGWQPWFGRVITFYFR